MTEKTPPLATVIITTMNRPALLREALKSLCRQLFTDFETIVVNDGGEDPAPVLAEFASCLEPRLIANERNMGVAHSRNRALEAARGRFIAYLDDDDFYYEDHLQILLAAIRKHGAMVVYSDANEAIQKKEDGHFVTVSRRVAWSVDFDPEKLCRSNYIPTLCLMHEKSCIDVVGGFREFLDRHEDWDLWLRFSRFFTFVHVNTATAEYTVREGALSLSKDEGAMNRSRLHVRLLGEYLAAMPRVEDLAAGIGKARIRRAFGAADAPLSVIMYMDGKSPLKTEALEALVNACPEGTEVMLTVDGDRQLAAWLDRSIEGDMTVIEHPARVGRTLANNHAAQRAAGGKLLFLGQDVLLEKDCLAAMLAALETGENIVAPGLRLRGNVLRGGAYDETGRLSHIRSPGDTEPGPATVPCVNAACMLVNRALFRRLKGFALRFAPGGYEDADFCGRAMRDAAVPSIVVPGSLAWKTGLRAGNAPESLYGAACFAAEWGKYPGWVPESESWVNAGAEPMNGGGREESEVYRLARLPRSGQES